MKKNPLVKVKTRVALSYSQPSEDGPVNIEVEQGEVITVNEITAKAWAQRKLVDPVDTSAAAKKAAKKKEG